MCPFGSFFLVNLALKKCLETQRLQIQKYHKYGKKGALKISDNVKDIIDLHPKGLGSQLEVWNVF